MKNKEENGWTEISKFDDKNREQLEQVKYLKDKKLILTRGEKFTRLENQFLERLVEDQCKKKNREKK